MRDTDSEDITSYSVMVNNDGFSKGKHHWIAHKMNNSDQDSSKRVTCNDRDLSTYFDFLGFLNLEIT